MKREISINATRTQLKNTESPVSRPLPPDNTSWGQLWPERLRNVASFRRGGPPPGQRLRGDGGWGNVDVECRPLTAETGGRLGAPGVSLGCLAEESPHYGQRVCGLWGQPGGVGRDGEETHFLPWSTMSELSFLCFSGPQFPSLYNEELD